MKNVGVLIVVGSCDGKWESNSEISHPNLEKEPGVGLVRPRSRRMPTEA
jgi:hypothetical protein